MSGCSNAALAQLAHGSGCRAPILVAELRARPARRSRAAAVVSISTSTSAPWRHGPTG
jgi:hypothetical protein